MKEAIHPEYHDAEVECVGCGSKFTVGSVQAVIKTNVCSSCHPFFTGKQVLVDAEGRVQRFMKKYAKVQPAAPAAKEA